MTRSTILGSTLVLAAFSLSACGGDDDSGGHPTPLYAACATTTECGAPADTCITIAWEPGRDGAMCSLYCDNAGVASPDCPSGGSCWELVGDPVPGTRICYESCTSDTDCPLDFTCANAEMDGTIVDHICLPN